MPDNYQAWDINPQNFYKQTTPQDKLKFILNFAILAPSSHNTQPWLFKIGHNEIQIHADFSRHLVKSDESNRMIYTAIGAAIENIKIAADHYGYSLDVAYNSELKNSFPKFVAKITFKKTDIKKYPQGAFGAMVKRVSSRGDYQDKVPLERDLEALKSASNNPGVNLVIITERNLKEIVANIMGIGMKEKMSLRVFRWELASWLRHNRSKKKDGMPGHGHNMSFVLSLFAPFILRFINVSSVERKKAIKRVNNFPAIAILQTPNDNAQEWVLAGEIMQKLLVKIHELGMSAGIMVATIESDEARKNLQKAISENNNSQNKFTQMFFGFGFPTKVAPRAPRRDLQDVLL